MASSKMFSIPMGLPMSVMTDSYKAAHFEQYPEAKKMIAYGEFRAPFKESDPREGRFVFTGIRYLIETYLMHKWTEADVNQAAAFYSTHNAGFKPFPFPKDLFLKFVKENDGWFPVVIQALDEGTCAHIHVPVYQITAADEYSRLVTFLETIMTHVWYPSTVATLSRRTRDYVEAAYDKSVDDSGRWSIESRLHDFGCRGVTCVEQAVLGGAAHLISFLGSDNMPACFHCQYQLNDGRPVAQSIPATEHSVMTSWPTENAAMANMIDKYGDGVFACVMDSYDYVAALTKVMPSLKDQKVSKGGVMVLRPDSGEPVEAVMLGVTKADECFGHTVNSKGYKVLNKIGVIQGDGINIAVVQAILKTLLEAGYSAENVAFGMGGGLLQKVNRDTMSFATKLSYIHYASTDQKRDIMKKPKTDSGKTSLPGALQVKPDANGIPTVFPRDADAAPDADDLLRVVWNKGPVKELKWPSFDEVRERVKAQWTKLPQEHNPISPELQKKIDSWTHEVVA